MLPGGPAHVAAPGLPGTTPYAVGHFTQDGPDMEMWGRDHDAEPVLRAALHGHLELIRCERPL